MGSLDGAVVVITGSSRGIGRAIAEELGLSGAKVIVNYHQSRQAADDVVARLKQSGSKSVAIKADVSDPTQAARLIEETFQLFARIDVLVNNAGINIDRTMKNLSTDDWDTVIKADLSSYFYTVRAALPHFMQQKSGKIINISSMNAESGSFGQANYAAAKAGIIGFTKVDGEYYTGETLNMNGGAYMQ
jgi:acetoacetyl-CoA reductase